MRNQQINTFAEAESKEKEEEDEERNQRLSHQTSLLILVILREREKLRRLRNLSELKAEDLKSKAGRNKEDSDSAAQNCFVYSPDSAVLHLSPLQS
ncbi:hypothetical protein LINPERPRIM_LOCUS31367 [Linum perenne]